MMSSAQLPTTPAAERNKHPILDILRACLPKAARVLEIGSGTGQHAVHFACHLPEVSWQASEMPEHLPLLAARIDQEGGAMPVPLPLDVMGNDWPGGGWDAVFTANTLHIMPWGHTPILIERAASRLIDNGKLIIYGPFHDNGVHTAQSNLQFDRMLRSRNPDMGVRDAVEIRNLAGRYGLEQVADIAMPANNRMLIFRRVTAEA